MSKLLKSKRGGLDWLVALPAITALPITVLPTANLTYYDPPTPPSLQGIAESCFSASKWNIRPGREGVPDGTSLKRKIKGILKIYDFNMYTSGEKMEKGRMLFTFCAREQKTGESEDDELSTSCNVFYGK